MSKMFEAITRLDGDLTRIVLPVISAAGGIRAGQSDPRVEEEAVRTTPSVESGEIRTCRLQPAVYGPLVIDGPVSSIASEQYRMIRTRILQHYRKTKLLLVSSPTPGDGKTVTAINVGSIHALRNSRVLLIDSDLRRPSFATTLGIPDSLGLGDVLSGTAHLQNAIIQAEQVANLYVLPAGKHAANPAELLDSAVWKTLCATVCEYFDFVVLDAPPVAAVADYELLQASCDSVLLVVRPDHTNKAMLASALSLVPEDKLLGIVVNCESDWLLSKRQHSYYYYAAERH